MTFARPEMLWLLLGVAPLLAVFLVWSWRKRQALIRRFVQDRLRPQLVVGFSPGRQKLRLALAGLAALLLLLALARPQYGFAWEELHRRGLDLVVAVDTSRSMLAADVSPDRLTRAKLAVRDLQRLARTDRLALVAFAGTAFLQCPLTLDDQAFAQSLDLLNVDLLPVGGSSLGAAIEEALRAFKDSGRNHRVILLFSDGEDHESETALAAAARAAEAGVKIFTVGVGTATGDRLRLVDAQGRTSYVLDENNQPVISRLNAELLRQIARKTGGDYLPLLGADPMKTLYEARLAPLPGSDLTARWTRQYHERFQWPLALAWLCLVAEMLLLPRRPPPPAPPPRSPAAGGRHPAAAAGFALLLAALAIPTTHASPASALRDYARGKYRSAEQEYRRLLRERPDDARLHYNAGTAAYAAGEFAAATNHLEAATRTTDPDLLARVYYNLGNALYRLGERADVPTLTLTNWQQALQQYQNTLDLNPGDADARHNLELVRARLEALQQQMTPPPPPPQGGSSSPDSAPPQSGQKPDSSPAHSPSPSASSPQDQSPSQQSAPSPLAGENQASPRPSAPEPPEQKPPGAQPKPAQNPAPADNPSDGSSTPSEMEMAPSPSDPGQGTAPVAPGALTPGQARQLLEAARVEEKAWPPAPPASPPNRRVRRDW